MYADDSIIMYSSTNSAEIETGLNADLDTVSVWLKRIVIAIYINLYRGGWCTVIHCLKQTMKNVLNVLRLI